MIKDKRIVLGISGSISAYKTPWLIRDLLREGVESVRTVVTKSALEFVTKSTLANVSLNDVIDDTFSLTNKQNGAWHVALSHNCDLIVVAPASANTIAKFANGICDNALLNLILAKPDTTPILLCPAMDYTMYDTKQNKRNLELLKDYGYHILEPEYGELSSGLIGKGRLPGNEAIIEKIKEIIGNEQLSGVKIEKVKNEKEEISLRSEIDLLELKSSIIKENLRGKKVLITAGPTVEKLDDVRFISNFSTGKMGYSIAKESAQYADKVMLVTGPTHLDIPENVISYDVTTAQEMYKQTLELYESENPDIIIMSAAVADYRAKSIFDGKIKKSESETTITLTKNPDILKEVGKRKKSNQYLIGFALESQDAELNALNKLKEKNCNLIVLNYANIEDSGFGGEMNIATLITEKKQMKLPKLSKLDLAKKILENVGM